jgi:hypothetical protein
MYEHVQLYEEETSRSDSLFATANMKNVGHRRSIRLLKRTTVDRTIGDENNRGKREREIL